jgi:hypothetical protein
MSRRNRYFARSDDALPWDAWPNELPDPNPDNFPDSADEWMWARGVQDSRLPHEINDAEARAVLDAHDWRLLPNSWEPFLFEVLHDERARCDKERRRANPLKPRVLTAEVVSVMRRRYQRGERIQQLAVRFGISYATTRRAVIGQTWATVTPPPCERAAP